MYGRNFYVNLGVHLDFLPTAGGSTVDAGKLHEYHCQFRTRLDPPQKFGRSWAYGNTPDEASDIAARVHEAFKDQGESFFGLFEAFPESFLDTSINDFGATSRKGLARYTPFPLTFALIYQQLGNWHQVRTFAAHGLELTGAQAVVLIKKYKDLLLAAEQVIGADNNHSLAMISSSAIINKAFRKYLSSVVRDAGFQKVDARNGWAWQQDCVWVFNVRAVGRYFTDVTGWSPASVCASLGVFYTFIPEAPNVKSEQDGKHLPTEYQCHMRSYLTRGLPQDDYLSALRNPAEQARRDLWWLEPDGSNAEAVAADIAETFRQFAIPWYARCTDLNSALAKIETDHDCFSKYVLAAYVSGKLGLSDLNAKYVHLAEEEGARIDVHPDPQQWFLHLGGIPAID